MAVVDIQTGEIIRAKKGTLTWQHEVGHIKYNKSEKGIFNSFLEQKCFEFAFGLIVLYLCVSFIFPESKIVFIFLFLLAASSLGYFGLQAYEEIWCWGYAFKHKEEFEKK